MRPIALAVHDMQAYANMRASLPPLYTAWQRWCQALARSAACISSCRGQHH
jgi:hypothetical protein